MASVSIEFRLPDLRLIHKQDLLERKDVFDILLKVFMSCEVRNFSRLLRTLSQEQLSVLDSSGERVSNMAPLAAMSSFGLL